MKFFFFLFLLCIPVVSAVGVSPSNVTFVGDSATIYVVNDHAFPVSYKVFGGVDEQVVVLQSRQILPLNVTLNDSRSEDMIRVEEVVSGPGLLVAPSIAIPFTTGAERRGLLSRFTGAAVSRFEPLDLSHKQVIVIGCVSMMFVAVVLVWFFRGNLFKVLQKKEKPRWTTKHWNKSGRKSGWKRKSSMQRPQKKRNFS